MKRSWLEVFPRYRVHIDALSVGRLSFRAKPVFNTKAGLVRVIDAMFFITETRAN